MNQLRHLAIRTEEPEKLVAFYKEAFGFREVNEGMPPASLQESRSFPFHRRLFRTGHFGQRAQPESKRFVSLRHQSRGHG